MARMSLIKMLGFGIATAGLAFAVKKVFGIIKEMYYNLKESLLTTRVRVEDVEFIGLEVDQNVKTENTEMRKVEKTAKTVKTSNIRCKVGVFPHDEQIGFFGKYWR